MLSRRLLLTSIDVELCTGQAMNTSGMKAIGYDWLSRCLSVTLEVAGVEEQASFEFITKGANRDVFKGTASGECLVLKLQ